jgi:pantothenate kinase
MTDDELAALVLARAGTAARVLVAIAGPPGAGKSTRAAALASRLHASRVVPMDGFHYDDRVLEARGLRARKGAPETFDAAGFIHLIRRLKDNEPEVAIPVFDRGMEMSRAAADVVTRADRILLVEGNYLLLNETPWDALAPLWDVTVFLDVPEAELDRRLMRRWARHGKSPEAARAWIDGNDRPNIRRVQAGSRPAGIVVPG